MKLSEAKGDWALITGASSGIGREFAKQLAQKGMNVALVARRDERLEKLAEELTSTHKVYAMPLVIDLTDQNATEQIKSRLEAEHIKVRLLINNAAFGYWGYFSEASVERYEQMVQLNILTTINLCHQFLSDLASFPTSAIINVSSQGAINPVPYMTVYAATKAFVSSFSQALFGELGCRGVLVQTLIPGPTETEFDSLAGAPPISKETKARAEEVVKKSLSHIATAEPVVSNAKGLFKQRMFATLAPTKIMIQIVGKMFRPPDSVKHK